MNGPIRPRVLAVAALLLFGASVPASAQKAVLLVRHAEKVDESKDPPLSAAGKARARALARYLRSAGVTAIYVTQYQRTALTAAPLAAAASVKPVVIHADERQPLVDRIRKEKGVVLVVGHSDTVPAILRLLGHPEAVTIAHPEHDNLFVVIPHASGPPSVVRLRY
jgi:broad specificity phosphatase PhoE